MGWPVEHSLSPLLHNYWLKQYGIDGAYVPLPVHPDKAHDAIRMLPSLGFAGCNVTLPHKITALHAMDEVSDTARAIGAVNTIVCRSDGSLWGTNTDAYGFIENIRQTVPNWKDAYGNALVLGGSGAARAIAYGLSKETGKTVYIANRTREKAEAIAQELEGDIQIIDWEERESILSECRIVANATSLGLKGKPELEIDLCTLPKGSVVADAIYYPLHTALLKQAEAKGHIIVDGLGMMIHQAREGFNHWFGTMPEANAQTTDLLLEKLKEAE